MSDLLDRAADELRDKIARLPAWARNHIRRLELRAEPMVEEAVRARKKASDAEERCGRLSGQVEAMTEIFRRAAVGGSDVAATVVKILEGYEFYPKAKNNQ